MHGKVSLIIGPLMHRQISVKEYHVCLIRVELSLSVVPFVQDTFVDAIDGTCNRFCNLFFYVNGASLI